jgi:hypothetical protein
MSPVFFLYLFLFLDLNFYFLREKQRGEEVLDPQNYPHSQKEYEARCRKGRGAGVRMPGGPSSLGREEENKRIV